MNLQCRKASKAKGQHENWKVISRKFYEYFPVSNKNVTIMYTDLKNCAESKIRPRTP